jgi:2',3'-cyclic-nucleotide 2'-phosphodiesterase (5'-nucleotidase family)
MYKIFLTLCIGASLLACSSHLQVYSNRIALGNSIAGNKSTDSIITPYRDSMNRSMNKVIAFSENDFIVERPSSNLMNWVADAIFIQQTQTIKINTPIICLLNTGGIRSSLGKGNLTVGDFFKLMPFDNTLVWVEMPFETLSEIGAFITKTGGEPISNCTVQNGKIQLNSMPEGASHFIIITSDYLAYGGDKMDFFKKGKIINETGKLMRDVLIEHAKQQSTLISTNEIRVFK